MSSYTQEETELNQKHEDILTKRTLLLQQMQVVYEEQETKKKQQFLNSQAAKERNTQILKDIEREGEKLQTKQLLHPDIISLETRYWASVEKKLPEWEPYLLGNGQPPTRNTRRTPKHQIQKTVQPGPSPARYRSKPPLPK
ncbi:hypothetical protein DNTS_008556 [Danionella cerebrum]|uniref:Uncharacterized protein n=1 Tax=Danionella cerebrum TaxID=2873325 RepID=A0A553MYE4_9TELE|nr:hypothetical protein DNTS_008556 [Danionella translucida]